MKIMVVRLAALTAIVWLLAGNLSAAPRTWTDNQGRRTVAEYQGIENGNVILLKGKQEIPVPFFTLSAKDREFLTRLLEKKGEADQLPKAGEMRVWTDEKGQHLEAQFIGCSQFQIHLLVGPKVVSLPFSSFSDDDQKYVREEMLSRGLGYLLPPEKKPDTVAGQTPGSAAGSAAGSIPIAINSAQPSAGHSDAASAGTPITVNAGSASSPSPYNAHSQSSGSASAAGANPDRSFASAGTPNLGPAAPVGPQFRWVVKCSRCFRELPEGTAAGSPCPYCNPAAENQASSNSGSYRLSGRGMRGLFKLGVGVAIAVVSGVVYMFTRRN